MIVQDGHLHSVVDKIGLRIVWRLLIIQTSTDQSGPVVSLARGIISCGGVLIQRSGIKVLCGNFQMGVKTKQPCSSLYATNHN